MIIVARPRFLRSVVSHPSEWNFGGYNEIQKPRKKCAIIAYGKLAELSGFSNYESFKKSHCEYVTESLHNDVRRQSWWSESIAVGDESFVDNIKQNLKLRVKGRKVKEAGEGFQLREATGTYISDFDLKNPYIERFCTFSAGENFVNTEL